MERPLTWCVKISGCAPADSLQWKHTFMYQHHSQTLWQGWNHQCSGQALHHSPPRLSWQHPASADSFFTVVTSLVWILLSSSTVYLLMRVMGIAKPIWQWAWYNSNCSSFKEGTAHTSLSAGASACACCSRSLPQGEDSALTAAAPLWYNPKYQPGFPVPATSRNSQPKQSWGSGLQVSNGLKNFDSG